MLNALSNQSCHGFEGRDAGEELSSRRSCAVVGLSSRRNFAAEVMADAQWDPATHPR